MGYVDHVSLNHVLGPACCGIIIGTIISQLIIGGSTRDLSATILIIH